jgi:hypothetical protein
LLVAGVAVAAFALIPDGTDPGLATATPTILPAETTTAPVITTTTSTTTPTTTTTVPTPDSVAGEIAAHLEELDPPGYHPKDVKRVFDALDAVMKEWADDDEEEELTDALERMGEAIQNLPDSEDTDHLMDHFVEIAELMGLEVRSGSDDD